MRIVRFRLGTTICAGSGRRLTKAATCAGRLTMGTCNCKSKNYGHAPKSAWGTKSEADAECEKYKQSNRNTDPDWHLMSSYECTEGNGFHIGHKRPPDFEPRREWPQEARIPMPVREGFPLGEIAHGATVQGGVPLPRAVPVQDPGHAPPAVADANEENDKGIGDWAKLMTLVAVKVAKQVAPVVERGSRALLGWAIDGLKASVDYLSDVQKKLEQKGKK